MAISPLNYSFFFLSFNEFLFYVLSFKHSDLEYTSLLSPVSLEYFQNRQYTLKKRKISVSKILNYQSGIQLTKFNSILRAPYLASFSPFSLSTYNIYSSEQLQATKACDDRPVDDIGHSGVGQ